MELGLIGRSLGHSFSRAFFNNKFEQEGLSGYHYRNFELARINEFPALLQKHPQLAGLNVTIPYKSQIIPLLDVISEEALEIEAVNVIRIRNGSTTGFNTDHSGFRESLMPLLRGIEDQALILGSGGAARAVVYALKSLGIKSQVVSRKPTSDQMSYRDAGIQLAEFPLVVNCTPLGTYPEQEQMPPLPLDNVSENHLFYDLIYNPAKTRWLKQAEKRGARAKNGYEMLVRQAEAAWRIWHAK
mgnify:CR=1 FL=1